VFWTHTVGDSFFCHFCQMESNKFKSADLSSLPDARTSSWGWKSKELMAAEWSRNSLCSWPPVTSHSCTNTYLTCVACRHHHHADAQVDVAAEAGRGVILPLHLPFPSSPHFLFPFPWPSLPLPLATSFPLSSPLPILFFPSSLPFPFPSPSLPPPP